MFVTYSYVFVFPWQGLHKETAIWVGGEGGDKSESSPTKYKCVILIPECS